MSRTGSRPFLLLQGVSQVKFRHPMMLLAILEIWVSVTFAGLFDSFVSIMYWSGDQMNDLLEVSQSVPLWSGL